VLDGLSLLTADSHYKISTGTSVVTGSKACIHNAITNVFTVWFVAKQKWSPNFSPTDLAVAQGSWYHQVNRFRNSTRAAPQTSFGLEYAFFQCFFFGFPPIQRRRYLSGEVTISSSLPPHCPTESTPTETSKQPVFSCHNHPQ
jgi:hypothetical protein